MPIVLAPINELLKVVKIITDPKVKKHLESLGIACGSTLEVLEVSGGNVILLVGKTRLAIDKDIARRIFVSN